MVDSNLKWRKTELTLQWFEVLLCIYLPVSKKFVVVTSISKIRHRKCLSNCLKVNFCYCTEEEENEKGEKRKRETDDEGEDD